jgi:c-di-GMP-binding flagellar brake protein YcgR
MSDGTLYQASDARQDPRVNVSWAARVVVGPQAYLEARVVNISNSGMGLVCETAFREGATIDVMIAMPDVQDRGRYTYPQMQAKVAFQIIKGSKFRLGVQLVKIDPAAKAMLARWVDQG